MWIARHFGYAIRTADFDIAMYWQGLTYPDVVILVIAYAQQLERFELVTNADLPSDTECLLNFPNTFEGLPIALWVTFKNASDTMSATSCYLGRLEI